MNSNNQELFYHIHCIGYIFYHQSTKTFFVSLMGSYSKTFTLDSIHQISQTFLIQLNIFVFIMTYFCKNISIHTLYFFMLTTIIYPKRAHLWVQSNKFFNSNTSCFMFHLSKHLISLNHQNTLT